MLQLISQPLRLSAGMLILLYGMVLAESSTVAAPAHTGQPDGHYLMMGFIPDTTASSDSTSANERQLRYQPGNDSYFLKASSGPADFAPLKRDKPTVPDRPDIFTDLAPYSSVKK